MTPIVWTYVAYLAISIALTVWVAGTLHRNGRIFLVDALGGNEPLADSINHLLVVGFYLINIGYVSLAMRSGEMPENAQGMLELLSQKVGVVLVVLGAMHFFNLFTLSRIRRKAVRRNTEPPAFPEGWVRE